MALAEDGAGNLYVGEYGNSDIKVVNAATGAISTVPNASGLGNVNGIALDATGNLYAASPTNNVVYLSTVAGTGSASSTGDNGAATSATLTAPNSVAVGAAADVYITEESGRIRKVTKSTGIITTVAGTGTDGFSGDNGPATSGQLNYPEGVTLDNAGNLYIFDTNNNRIREVADTVTAALSFATTSVGSVSSDSPQIATLLNEGNAPLTLSTGAVSSSSSFVMGTNGCTAGTTIAAGSACTVQVSFKPQTVGSPLTRTLQATDSAGTVHSFALSGSATVGTPSVVVISSPTIPYGTSSTNLAATVAYGGAAPTGAVTFQVDTGTTVPATCAPLSSTSLNCTASYTTSMLSVGSHLITAREAADNNYMQSSGTGTLTVADTLASLQVSGIPAIVSPGVAQTLVVKAIGASDATFTGFTGTVTLTSTDPAATLNPASYTFTPNDAGQHSFSVTFNTGGSYSVTATSGSATATVSTRVGDYIWTVSNTGATTRGTEAGTAVTSTGGGQTASLFGGLAFDNVGNSYSVLSSSNSVARTGNTDGALTPLTGGGLNAPTAVAISGTGMVWVANAGNNSLSAFNANGTAVSGTNGVASASVAAPSSLAIDNTGGVWVTNKTAGTVTHLFGAAAPVITPLTSAAGNAQLGVKP